jgi:hypothetical protein
VRGARNQFSDESILQRISSLTRLCGVAKQVADESVLKRISSLTSLCFSESVR